MNYGVCAVRFDLGKEARIQTGQFFNIPGSLSQAEMVSFTLAKDITPSHLSSDIGG